MGVRKQADGRLDRPQPQRASPAGRRRDLWQYGHRRKYLHILRKIALRRIRIIVAIASQYRLGRRPISYQKTGVFMLSKYHWLAGVALCVVALPAAAQTNAA
ncbi:MAG: hypothetical protein ACK4S5_01690, partial [Sphingobium yanoikuyae]